VPNSSAPVDGIAKRDGSKAGLLSSFAIVTSLGLGGIACYPEKVAQRCF
jgi:hypothetical protein